jgi:hypothetical protein
MRRYRATKADREVFLEYHNTDQSSRDYAKAKLASGTAPLYPESLAVMQREIARRKLVKDTADQLAAQDKAEREAAHVKQ